ncbi:hypothetical protein SUGI_0761270 [Cryptomeria japonica]|nr:hypothetical protein SUGI_0761270 [Cryptomeria japonica]
MALDIAGWDLALAMKRPLKTELYELYTIYEEDENTEDTLSDHRHKSQLERFSNVAIFIGVMVSLVFLLLRPLLKSSSLALS